MLATIGVQPSELSSIVNLAKGSLTQNKAFCQAGGAEPLLYRPNCRTLAPPLPRKIVKNDRKQMKILLKNAQFVVFAKK